MKTKRKYKYISIYLYYILIVIDKTGIWFHIRQKEENWYSKRFKICKN